MASKTVSISKKPTSCVSGLSLKRDGAKLEAAWKEPSSLTKKSNSARHGKEKCVFQLCEKPSNGKWAWKQRESATVKVGKRKASHSIPTADYYPRKSNGRKVSKARVKVYAVNKKGTGKATAWEDLEIDVPSSPKLSNVSISVSGDTAGRVSCDVSVPKASGKRHRWDVLYWVEKQSRLYDEQAGAIVTSGVVPARGKTAIMANTDNGTTVSVVEPRWQDLRNPGEWILYTFKAVSRGLRGDSSQASASYTICWPYKPSIKDAVYPDGKDRITVPLTYKSDVGAGERYVTDRLQLQIAMTDAEYPSADDWKDLEGAQVGPTATAITWSEDITPAIGEHVYLRVKATNDITTYVQYSNVIELEGYYRAPKDSSEASESEVGIVSAESGADGKSLKVVVGWNGTGMNATEVAYSDDPDAWRSDTSPNSMEMETDATWEDAESQAPDKYGHTAWVKLTKGIEEGSTYHVKARRYSTGDGESTGWTPATQVRTTTVPQGVVASAPAIVALGSPCTLSWTIGGDAAQAAYMVRGADGAGIGQGGSEQSHVIPAEMLPEGSHSFRVEVQTTAGGDWAVSDEVHVTVRPAPVCTVGAPAVLAAKPLELACSCDAPGARVTFQLVAEGVTSALPDGREAQLDGDVVWSAAFESWDAATESVQVPEDVRLIDGARYRVRMAAVADGLVGEVAHPVGEDGAEQPVTVEWAHQAVAPGDVSIEAEGRTAVIVANAPDGYVPTPDEEVEEGKAYYELQGGAYVPVESPTEAGLDGYYERRYADGDGPAATDVLDVYRKTKDGCTLIASGVAFGTAVTDPYAPFSDTEELEYRLATRTADGDVDWADEPYELPGSALRIDWDAKAVELVFDLELSDGFEKSFEGRTFLDGTHSGDWGDGTVRKASYSCSIVGDQAAEELLRELAVWAGPAFVRTPDGLAYEANVEVGEIARSASTGKVTCSLDAEQVEPDGFMAEVAAQGGDAA